MAFTRPTVTAFAITTLLSWAMTGCTGPKPVKAPIQPISVAATAPQDPMVVQLAGRLANEYVQAASATEVIARLRIDTKPFAREKRPAIDLALAMDTSGSMQGDAMDQARDAALQLLEQLEVGDRLAVVAFHSTSEIIVPLTAITDSNKAGIAKRIGAMQATGTTDMAGGLSLAVQQLASQRVDDRMARLVLLSDGVPNDEAPIMSLAQQARDYGVAITALGLGVEYNETLMANVAQHTGGAFHYIEEPSLVAAVFRDEVLRLQRVVAQGMNLTLSPGPGVNIREVIGHTMYPVGGRVMGVQLGDIGEGEVQDVLVRLDVGSHRSGVNVELLDGVLTFADAIAGAGTYQRRVFLAARATADTATLEAGRDQEIEEAVESAVAAVATIAAVANARAGNIMAAEAILDTAASNARQAGDRYHNKKLTEQADEMTQLRQALPTMVAPQPNGTVVVTPGRAAPTAADSLDDSVAAETAPATVRTVHGNAMRTLQGR